MKLGETNSVKRIRWKGIRRNDSNLFSTSNSPNSYIQYYLIPSIRHVLKYSNIPLTSLGPVEWTLHFNWGQPGVADNKYSVAFNRPVRSWIIFRMPIKLPLPNRTTYREVGGRALPKECACYRSWPFHKSVTKMLCVAIQYRDLEPKQGLSHWMRANVSAALFFRFSHVGQANCIQCSWSANSSCLTHPSASEDSHASPTV